VTDHFDDARAARRRDSVDGRDATVPDLPNGVDENAEPLVARSRAFDVGQRFVELEQLIPLA
jgi:hypothetical protein